MNNAVQEYEPTERNFAPPSQILDTGELPTFLESSADDMRSPSRRHLYKMTPTKRRRSTTTLAYLPPKFDEAYAYSPRSEDQRQTVFKQLPSLFRRLTGVKHWQVFPPTPGTRRSLPGGILSPRKGRGTPKYEQVNRRVTFNETPTEHIMPDDPSLSTTSSGKHPPAVNDPEDSLHNRTPEEGIINTSTSKSPPYQMVDGVLQRLEQPTIQPDDGSEGETEAPCAHPRTTTTTGRESTDFAALGNETTEQVEARPSESLDLLAHAESNKANRLSLMIQTVRQQGLCWEVYQAASRAEAEQARRQSAQSLTALSDRLSQQKQQPTNRGKQPEPEAEGIGHQSLPAPCSLPPGLTTVPTGPTQPEEGEATVNTSGKSTNPGVQTGVECEVIRPTHAYTGNETPPIFSSPTSCKSVQVTPGLRKNSLPATTIATLGNADKQSPGSDKPHDGSIHITTIPPKFGESLSIEGSDDSAIKAHMEKNHNTSEDVIETSDVSSRTAEEHEAPYNQPEEVEESHSEREGDTSAEAVDTSTAHYGGIGAVNQSGSSDHSAGCLEPVPSPSNSDGGGDDLDDIPAVEFEEERPSIGSGKDPCEDHTYYDLSGIPSVVSDEDTHWSAEWSSQDLQAIEHELKHGKKASTEEELTGRCWWVPQFQVAQTKWFNKLHNHLHKKKDVASILEAQWEAEMHFATLDAMDVYSWRNKLPDPVEDQYRLGVGCDWRSEARRVTLPPEAYEPEAEEKTELKKFPGIAKYDCNLVYDDTPPVKRRKIEAKGVSLADLKVQGVDPPCRKQQAAERRQQHREIQDKIRKMKLQCALPRRKTNKTIKKHKKNGNQREENVFPTYEIDIAPAAIVVCKEENDVEIMEPPTCKTLTTQQQQTTTKKGKANSGNSRSRSSSVQKQQKKQTEVEPQQEQQQEEEAVIPHSPSAKPTTRSSTRKRQQQEKQQSQQQEKKQERSSSSGQEGGKGQTTSKRSRSSSVQNSVQETKSKPRSSTPVQNYKAATSDEQHTVQQRSRSSSAQNSKEVNGTRRKSVTLVQNTEHNKGTTGHEQPTSKRSRSSSVQSDKENQNRRESSSRRRSSNEKGETRKRSRSSSIENTIKKGPQQQQQEKEVVAQISNARASRGPQTASANTRRYTASAVNEDTNGNRLSDGFCSGPDVSDIAIGSDLNTPDSELAFLTENLASQGRNTKTHDRFSFQKRIDNMWVAEEGMPPPKRRRSSRLESPETAVKDFTKLDFDLVGTWTMASSLEQLPSWVKKSCKQAVAQNENNPNVFELEDVLDTLNKKANSLDIRELGTFCYSSTVAVFNTKETCRSFVFVVGGGTFKCCNTAADPCWFEHLNGTGTCGGKPLLCGGGVDVALGETVEFKAEKKSPLVFLQNKS